MSDPIDETGAAADAITPDGAPEAVPAEAPVDGEAVDATSASDGPGEATAAVDAPVEAASMAPADADDVAPEGLKPFVVDEWVYGAIEALCFVAAEPITPARVREVLAGEMPTMDGLADMAPPTTAQVKDIFTELLRRWNDPTRATGLGFRLIEVDGGLTFRTLAGQARFVRRMQMGKPQKLSRAALETLAVVAYRQPVTKPQIEEIRGVDCSGALKALLDKKLVRILGKAEDVGRPLLYGTSRTFLDFFNLQSLNDLPTLKQLQELDGVAPAPVETGESGPAMVMDLFQKDGPGLISSETEEESADALDALERALGEARKVAKTASTLVFGVEVPDEEGKPPANE